MQLLMQKEKGKREAEYLAEGEKLQKCYRKSIKKLLSDAITYFAADMAPKKKYIYIYILI